MDSEEPEVNLDVPWTSAKLDDEEKEEASTFADNKILRMMKMMGYQSGCGLGKNNQGIVQPVTVQTQYQRRGLGLKIENLQSSTEEWDFSAENITPIESVEWLHSTFLSPIDMVNITSWFKEDKPKANIDEEYNFCDKDTLHDVITAKNIFDHLNLKELNQARTRANPFETIRSVFFMNRASLKMANIDAATDFMFTNITQNPYHKDNSGPYYFADVCAGPGGFTEYVLWRKKWLFKGFGFTLRGENDFKLTESVCASPVTFLPLYGVHNDGNVCCPENIDDFKEKVLFETQNEGVHFMMSDGGFSVEGQENLQEVLSKNIYICQCLVALEILRKHGNFVTKVFDMFTCFSVGLFYLMCNCFEKVAILKPNSSRPANSERYLICSNYKGQDDSLTIRKYLRKLVDRLWKLRNDPPDLDVTEIVPLTILKTDDYFYSYICNSNNRIARNQTVSLRKLAAFCRNTSLVEHRQEELRSGCLKHWQIPDKPKESWSKYTIEHLLSETVHNRELLLVQPREIRCPEDCEQILENLQDWHYVPMYCGKNTNICNFYAGVASSRVYRLQCDKWVKVKNLQLIRGTLLYGELVKEKYFRTCSPSELQHRYSLHVIDALRLGDLNLTELNFEERQKQIDLYCKAVNHEFRKNSMRIRPKTAYKTESMPLTLSFAKDDNSEDFISRLPVLGYQVKEELFEVKSILFLKTNKDESFHSTYVLRGQYFPNDVLDDSEKHLPLEYLLDLIKCKIQ